MQSKKMLIALAIALLLGAGAAQAILPAMANAQVLPLEPRLPAGDGTPQAYYDPNLGITWAADANINGTDTWDNQVAWAAGLTIGGVSGWRLPSADVNNDDTVVDCFGGGVSGCVDNEMGFLYWEEGITAAAPGSFSNIQSDNDYWTSTERAIFPSNKWYFAFFNGAQGDAFNGGFFAAWAVRSGDVAVVPPPAAGFLPGAVYLPLLLN